MKKFNIFAMCLMFLCCSFLFVGCDNKSEYEKQGFIAVKSVEYCYETKDISINKEVLTSENIYSYTLDELSYEEFVNSELNQFYGYFDEDNKTFSLTYAKQSKYKTGQKLKIMIDPDKFYILTISNVENNFLYVKVLNQNQFEVKYQKGEHYLINAPYFKIEYFK